MMHRTEMQGAHCGVYRRPQVAILGRIDIVILSEFLGGVLRGWGVYQGKLPNNMEVSE